MCTILEILTLVVPATSLMHVHCALNGRCAVHRKSHATAVTPAHVGGCDIIGAMPGKQWLTLNPREDWVKMAAVTACRLRASFFSRIWILPKIFL